MQDKYIVQQKQLIEKIRDSLSKKSYKSTVVPMQKDYENDDRICLTSSASLPKNTSQKIIKNIIMPLKSIDPDHFYYSTERMHLTIKNIRTIHKPPLFTERDIARVDNLFKKIIPSFPALNFHLEDLVLFPTSISLIGYCDGSLKKLVRMLDSGLNKIGVPDDKKYFSNTIFFSNITICRLTHKPSAFFIKKVEELENIKIGELNVAKIDLVTCNAAYSPKTRKTISTYQLKK